MWREGKLPAWAWVDVMSGAKDVWSVGWGGVSERRHKPQIKHTLFWRTKSQIYFRPNHTEVKYISFRKILQNHAVKIFPELHFYFKKMHRKIWLLMLKQTVKKRKCNLAGKELLQYELINLFQEGKFYWKRTGKNQGGHFVRAVAFARLFHCWKRSFVMQQELLLFEKRNQRGGWNDVEKFTALRGRSGFNGTCFNLHHGCGSCFCKKYASNCIKPDW